MQAPPTDLRMYASHPDESTKYWEKKDYEILSGSFSFFCSQWGGRSIRVSHEGIIITKLTQKIKKKNL